MTVTPADAGPILLYDGNCALCNGLVRFLLRHDPGGPLRFAPLESTIGDKLRAQHPELAGVDSVVWMRGPAGQRGPEGLPGGRGEADVRSEAVLGALAYLGRPWNLLLVARLAPRPLRDAVYDWVARNRGRWFRRYDHCPLPPPGQLGRFLPP